MWNSRCYARLLIDNHITDQRPGYMGRFSSKDYVRLVKESGVESAMVYSCDHNGNCYYPTEVGHRHGNLGGRDLFGEVVSGLRGEGIVPVAYYTAVYHNDCARRLPGARIIDNVGHDHDGRYHFTCPNSPEALSFYKSQLAEILEYPIEGIFIDMTFWPTICCCDACRRRYGRDFPEVIDWDSPEWVGFQRFRERSLVEFAEELTGFIKERRPDITVTHQFSPVMHGWYLGQTDGIAAASDYASGDFYGNKRQQRFAVKAFDAYTRHPPFEFMTSRGVSLRDHTSAKSDEELLLSTITTLANGGAYLLIDAINPDGTLEEAFYRRFKRLNETLRPYRECVKSLAPRMLADVGIYFSMESCVDRNKNGLKLREFDGGCANNMSVRKNAVLDETLGVSDILTQMHIPWRVLTSSTKDFGGISALVVCNSAYLSAEECDRIREFVRGGGTLIATGATSLYDVDGNGGVDFALSDLFGVHYTGRRSDWITYSCKELLYAEGNVPLVRADADTRVDGLLTFPDFPANDPLHYASIHSNPPGDSPSEYPALTCHKYGRGKCVWMAAPVPLLLHDSQSRFLEGLFQEYLPGFVVASRNLPNSLEITVLESKDKTRRLLCLVNQQDQQPVIPLSDVDLAVKWSSRPTEVQDVLTGKGVEFQWDSASSLLSLHFDRIHLAEFLVIGGQ